MVALRLSLEEWARVKSFLRLLQVAENAQQAFSAEDAPTLYNGLPALEALYEAWSKRQSLAQYSEFLDALAAGILKIEEYYEKTAESHAYTFAMGKFLYHYIILLLTPYLQAEVLVSAETIFKKHYKNMYGSLRAPPSRWNLKTSTSKIERLLVENSSDDEDFRDGNDSFDELEPWRHEFAQYLNSVDVVLEGMSSVHWWRNLSLGTLS
ncbi:hypothetical protein C0992_004193 [Termitomyces sp. T32_za158]|nr:hypothetical protein C0992_004193 [Termitomyces sp. T32_za158]